jgi:2-keto-4-pentenoate hydratase/2-oxohepta-3-ene-1,7-dioic acid hydratase in catechol pathway
VQKGNTKDMIFNIDTIIAYVSRFMTLKIGDLIFTGTPSGVGPLAIGDELEAFIENKSLLKMKIK